MSNTPLVTIACITYNHESYIRNCLEGIVTQKTNFAFEVLVHEDCSTDNTAAIIREYEAKYPDLFRCVYQSENQFSKGILPYYTLFPMARGKYIALCDGDDWWIDPFKLQKQIDFLEGNSDFVACFHNVRVDCEGQISLFNSLTENHYPTTEDIIVRRWFIATSAFVFRNVLKEYPSWTNEIVNDDVLLFLLLAKEGRFYYMDDVMSVYRKHRNSVSAQLNKNAINLNNQIINLYTLIKPLYPQDYEKYINAAISNYQKENEKLQRDIDYPCLKWFNWRTYKRLIFRKLRLQRY